MRRHRRPAVDDAAHVARSETPPPPVQEHGLRRAVGGRHRLAALLEPANQGGCAALVDRQPPLLGALAEHRHRPPVDVDALAVEPAQLGDPEPRGVEQLEHGVVAQREGRGTRSGLLAVGPAPALAAVEQCGQLPVREHGGQAAGRRGGREPPAGIVGHQPPPPAPREVGAQRGSLARDGGPRVPPGRQVREVPAQEQAVDPRWRRDPGALRPCDEIGKVPEVRAPRRCRPCLQVAPVRPGRPVPIAPGHPGSVPPRALNRRTGDGGLLVAAGRTAPRGASGPARGRRRRRHAHARAP